VADTGGDRRRGVAGWVALLRTALGEPTFTMQVGPIIDGNLTCGRWHASRH
jgi:hypothetical protein